MRYQWTDALRLCVLYGLGYLAIAAAAVAAFRQWGADERETIEIVAACTAIVIGLIPQRNVLSSTIPGGIGIWRWWGALLLGLTIMVATLGLFALVWLVAENSGTPLSVWIVEVANPAVDRWLAMTDGPILDPSTWAPNAILSVVLVPILLLIYWPLASLISKRIGRNARPYLLAVCITAVLGDLGLRFAQGLAPHLLGGLPDAAFWTAVIAAAGTIGIIEGAILSIAFFAMSAPGTPAANPPAPGPDTPAS